MSIPALVRDALMAGMMPNLLRNISPLELAAAIINARRLEGGDPMKLDEHVAEARKLLADALAAVDSMIKTGKLGE